MLGLIVTKHTGALSIGGDGLDRSSTIGGEDQEPGEEDFGFDRSLPSVAYSISHAQALQRILVFMEMQGNLRKNH